VIDELDIGLVYGFSKPFHGVSIDIAQSKI